MSSNPGMATQISDFIEEIMKAQTASFLWIGICNHWIVGFYAKQYDYKRAFFATNTACNRVHFLTGGVFLLAQFAILIIQDGL